MPTLSPQAQTLITAFGRQPGVTPDQVKNLLDVINGSPALVDQFNDAVAQGYLQQIVPLAHANAGGEYSPAHKEMRLPLTKLTSPPDVGDMTFVLGHELQHGFNAASVRQAGIDFARDVRSIANSKGAIHDYTPAMAKLLAESRQDEASAEIAGWNAIVSAVKATNPNPALADIYNKAPGRLNDFIDVSGPSHNQVYSLKPNLAQSLNSDMTMPPHPRQRRGDGPKLLRQGCGSCRAGSPRYLRLCQLLRRHSGGLRRGSGAQLQLAQARPSSAEDDL